MATDSQDLSSPASKKPKADENREEAMEKQGETTIQVSDGKLQVTLLSENAKLPTKGSAQAAGYDLYAAHDAVIPAKGRLLVKTDIQVKVPTGTYGRVAPRSGLAVKEGIDVGAGVIDADYRGPVGVLLFNFNDTEFKVSAGERIAQLICEKIANVDIEQVSKLDDTERGDGGFGSTGTA